MSDFIISIDQGTTSSRAVLFSAEGNILVIAQTEFPQYFPEQGWVEHDPIEILNSTYAVMDDIFNCDELKNGRVVGIGITNQRETSVVWDKKTGIPIYNAIVWQDKRTTGVCEELKNRGLDEYTKLTTGLLIDPYFSGTKVAWILDHVDGARERAIKGELCFGTIDSWLLYNLTNKEVHATDFSNASRTMMFDITSLKWDEKMLSFLRVPIEILPKVFPSSCVFGHYKSIDFGEIPIASIMGDQQSALFGQGCFTAGSAKNTYGTGCFMLMNTGTEIPSSTSGLLNTIAWQINGVTTYALEGSVFIAGSALQWLRDGLSILEDVELSSEIAERESSLNPDSSVIVVPYFAGIGSPYWDMYARGAIYGLTRDSGRESIIRATLESLAFQSQDVLQAMQEDSGISIFKLQVDGGASANDYLMQFQANILGVEVERPVNLESTAAGVAYMAAITLGYLTIDDISNLNQAEELFKPSKSIEWRMRKTKIWNDAVKRTVTNL
ncbi:MAG: glycerol kinase [Bacteroidetes bacterium]|nr:MAG: glycerol kinase [Bacteroidota bacterium]